MFFSLRTPTAPSRARARAGTFDPPVRVFESAAILLHLAERAGRFVPTEPRARAECLNWLFWLQVAARPSPKGLSGILPVH